MQKWMIALIVCGSLGLVACAAPTSTEAEPAVVETAPEAVTDEEPLGAEAVEPVVESVVELVVEPGVKADPAPSEEAAAADTDWLTVTGRTEQNLAVIGNPDAPVTMIEYSDFM